MFAEIAFRRFAVSRFFAAGDRPSDECDARGDAADSIDLPIPPRKLSSSPLLAAAILAVSLSALAGGASYEHQQPMTSSLTRAEVTQAEPPAT